MEMTSLFDNHQEQTHVSSSFNGNSHHENSAPESSGAGLAMRHNPCISLDWTAEEQAILEDGLANGTSDNKRQCPCSSQERVSDPSAKSSHFAARLNVPPYAPPMITMDNDDGISYKANGGPTEELLEQNAQGLNQISATLVAFQIRENINLLCQTRTNILKIMNDLDGLSEEKMPPIPVKLNEELAKFILPILTTIH